MRTETSEWVNGKLANLKSKLRDDPAMPAMVLCTIRSILHEIKHGRREDRIELAATAAECLAFLPDGYWDALPANFR
jgi:hypothetical protein